MVNPLTSLKGILAALTPRTSSGQPKSDRPVRSAAPRLQTPAVYADVREFVRGLTPERIVAVFDRAGQYIDDQVKLAAELEEMHDHLAGTLDLRRAAVLRLDRILAAGNPDDPRSTQAAELAETAIVGAPWFHALREYLLRAIWWQWSGAELLYGVENGKWLPRVMRPIEPGRFHFDDDKSPMLWGDLTARTDLVAPVAGRFVLHSHSAVYLQPGRFAVVRDSAKLTYLSLLDLTGWGQMVDKWGQPFLSVQYADGLSNEQIQTIVDRILTLAGQMIIATPAGTTVNMEPVPDQSPHEKFQDFCRRALSKRLLGQDSSQNAMSGQETGATLQGNVRDDLRDRDASALDATLNEALLAPWCAWNFGPDVAPPTITHVIKESIDPLQRSQVYQAAKTLGLAVKRSQVYEDLAIEEPGADDEVLFAPVEPDAAAEELTFKREVVKAFLLDGTTNDVLYNATDVQSLLEQVNLPLEPNYEEPWLPIVVPAGGLATGEPIKDSAGDVVGGDVKPMPGVVPVTGSGPAGAFRTRQPGERGGQGGAAASFPFIFFAGGGAQGGTFVQPTPKRPKRDKRKGQELQHQAGHAGSIAVFSASSVPLWLPFEPLVKAVRKAAEGASSFEEFQAALPDLVGADDTLARSLDEATWGAYCAGRLNTADVVEAKGKKQTTAKRGAPVVTLSPGHLSPAHCACGKVHVLAGLLGSEFDTGKIARARFAEAIDQMAQRTDLLPKEEFLKLHGENRARAWTVARVAELDVLKDLHGAVGQAVEGGQSWREFKDSLDSIMEQRGWAGLEPWHAQLVYAQNVNMAHSAGRVTQARDAGVGYWRKLPSPSATPRTEHARYDGQVFSFGQKTPPPWDFGCKCEWEPVFDEELDDAERSRLGGAADQPPGADEFEWDASQYYRPLELRRGDYPAELWPVLRSLAADANALLKLRS